MPERTYDLSQLRLPSANLSRQDVAELVGLYVVYRDALGPFFAPLLEVEKAADRLARDWGSHDFEKAEQLISNAVALERQAQPMRDFLPEGPRTLLFESDYFGPRGCYYLWLKLWRKEPDELVTGAALVFGLLAASLSAVKARVQRSEEILLLSHRDVDGARSALTGAGLGLVAHVALPEGSYPEPDQTFKKLARSVLGVARKAMKKKKEVPLGLTDPDFGSLRQTTTPRSAAGQDNVGDAGLTLSALLPPDLTSQLNTETRRIVRAVGYDFLDKSRSGELEPLNRALETLARNRPPPWEEDQSPSKKTGQTPCAGSLPDRDRDAMAGIENRNLVDAMDRAASNDYLRRAGRRCGAPRGRALSDERFRWASFHLGKDRTGEREGCDLPMLGSWVAGGDLWKCIGNRRSRSRGGCCAADPRGGSRSTDS